MMVDVDISKAMHRADKMLRRALDAARAQGRAAAANDNRLPVVAFTGLAGSGKSTAADYLIGKGYTRVKFAQPLKDMLRSIGLTDEHIEGNLKDEPCDLLLGWTPRYAMQTLGTEWGRDLLGATFWERLWRRNALNACGSVVVDDCRFENEAAAVRDLGGIVIQIVGRGGIAGGHASEAGVEADAMIANRRGFADLYENIDWVLDEYAAARRAA